MEELETQPIEIADEDKSGDRLHKGLRILARIIARQIDLSRKSRQESPHGERDLEEEA